MSNTRESSRPVHGVSWFNLYSQTTGFVKINTLLSIGRCLRSIFLSLIVPFFEWLMDLFGGFRMCRDCRGGLFASWIKYARIYNVCGRFFWIRLNTNLSHCNGFESGWKVVKGDVGSPFNVIVTTRGLANVHTHCDYVYINRGKSKEQLKDLKGPL